MAQPGTTPKITQKDLQDKDLNKLNRLFGFVYGKVSALYGSQEQVDLQAAVITAPVIKITGQDQPPTDLDTVITLRTAMALFGPDAIRQALTTGAGPTGPTQPLSK